MFYKKGIDITNAKQMFNFLNEHYTYYTLNSWNQLQSIANNVKLYKLNLDGDWGNALGYIFDENDIGGLQYEINQMIEDWEADHPGYLVGFNGRSAGYMVLYNKENNHSVIPNDLLGYDTYEEFKDSIKQSWYGETIKDYVPMLRKYTQLVQSFDRLCDDIRNLVNEYSKMDYEAELRAAGKDL